MSDAATALATDPDAGRLDALCRELAEAADAVGEAARYASGLALGARLPAGALAGRGGGGRRRAWRTLLRTLTDPAGLGWAPRGRGLARAGWLAGVLAGRESLAVSTAVCGLKARIRVAGAERPELLADPDCAAVLRAVAEDRQADAARAFRALLRERGAAEAFTLLAPTFADVLAWHALTDENPFNDHAGWQVATGRAVTAEPLLGLGAALRAFCARGPGAGEPRTPQTGILEALDTTGTLAGYVRNTGLLDAAGALLVQRVTGPDGRLRHVVQLPDRDSSYAPAVARAVRALIPSGAELALVGHRLGAVTAMDLARDRDFTAVYAVTHVFAAGSPADARAPADPRTRVVPLPSGAEAGAGAAAVEGTVTGTRLLPLHEPAPPSWRSP
ncbi:hypothetical protein [Streptomyces sp. NBC_00091]|uniref:hypothetical protein n=1 Tax=Streptomyces sp. NBC_00091 TaxID=2975648 RepID=UPI00224F4F37|nr:hypothetical protein [Streptomyces sp. NBC_00091]MCX5380698.1 hypothetical protein [Streptomyces sp. NBC_00091]